MGIGTGYRVQVMGYGLRMGIREGFEKDRGCTGTAARVSLCTQIREKASPLLKLEP